MQYFNFDPYSLPPEAEALRLEVREFLKKELADYPAVLRSRSWAGLDPAFSRKMGEKGWIGITWPKKYGGAERSFFERYALLEELLASGAPVGSHWIADRQSGPTILRFGTDEQCHRILPGIIRGETYICIGMSEPDTGSDLASIRTKADKVDGGYLINGTKVWTTAAHHCEWMIALVRTSPPSENRHAGMSQFLINLKKDKGVTVSPIKNIAGENHFNMVVFEDFFVPDEDRIGEEGDGWKQVTAELAFERSGPERYMSSIQLLIEMIREAKLDPSRRAQREIGRLIAHLATLRRMSISVAGKLESRANPALEASVVKDLGAVYEQDLPEIAHRYSNGEASMSATTDFEQVRAYITQAAVSFSLRGGTREILRGIIARGLGLR
ncbi:MAG: acyl-CoA dehydrogenase [Sneathiella sp.]|uniref:acyl-CoA dehydrogenase family protein n=1 Tax=Sneathiella sp. TaxID=1964365 RepID=UPI000C653CFB|nr:acyl-CoA dehydrogenase family protein [Sneathiella sp.]MAL77979.1 acyl-CoA dehydrogenase [Sneathiella sp.]